ncbi:uncharacterized protein TNCV_4765551 [Trichonephila clavipes]|nr:uncharacterized protein TNCV_4765551 [Trichonephila clavipes]
MSQALDRDCLLQTVKHGGGSVMIWVAVSWLSAEPTVFLKGRITGKKHREILSDQVHPSMQTLLSAGDGTFKDDDAPVHAAGHRHEDELTIEELQEILNEEHQETQRNVSPSEQEEDERGPMPTSAIKDLLKKWEAVRAMVLGWHPNQADVSRVGDLYNDNAINYFRKILKKREKQSTLDVLFNTP